MQIEFHHVYGPSTPSTLNIVNIRGVMQQHSFRTVGKKIPTPIHPFIAFDMVKYAIYGGGKIDFHAK